MRRRIISSVLALAAGGVTMTGLTLTGVTAATAASGTPAANTTGYDKAFAGYVTGGPWRFRFVKTDVPVAKCRTVSGNNATVTMALAADNARDVAHIDVACGGGHGSVTFSTEAHGHGHFALSPEVGQVLRIEVFRNVAKCQDEFTATNLTTGLSRRTIVRTDCSTVYRHAIVGAALNDPSSVQPPATTMRLWTFRNTAITSNNGTHGTLCGPWPVTKFIATSNGFISGRVLAFPANLSNGCRNFVVNLNGA